VFAAVAGPHHHATAASLFAGSRAEIRAAAVQACLDLLVAECEQWPDRYVR
jgi:hypothetical protein